MYTLTSVSAFFSILALCQMSIEASLGDRMLRCSDARVIFSCIQRRPIMYTMLATILHNSPNIFLTADDESVTISLIVISFSCRYLMARLTASLSILGECSETSHLSTVSMCTIVPESISRSVYVQYLAPFPGESHLPSPANETVLLWYSSISFSLDVEKNIITIDYPHIGMIHFLPVQLDNNDQFLGRYINVGKHGWWLIRSWACARNEITFGFYWNGFLIQLLMMLNPDC